MRLLTALFVSSLALSCDSPVSTAPETEPIGYGTYGALSLTDVEIIGLNRAGIKVQPSCEGVKFYVPAKNASYVNVWVPELNAGTKYGPKPVNAWFTIKFPPGKYRYRLAVELVTSTGKIQDDRHYGDFTVTCPKPTTTTTTAPTCLQLNPPRYTVEGPNVIGPDGEIRGVVTFYNSGGEAMLYCGDRPALACKYAYVHCGDSLIVPLRGKMLPGETCRIEVTQ